MAEWPDIPTGKQASSILWSRENLPPPIARDPANRRFAVALEDRIVVVSFA